MLFGKPLSKMQVTQFKLVELMIAAHRGARAHLRLRAQAHRRRGRDAGDHRWPSSSAAASSRQVADECLQLHGGYGYMKESVAGRAFVDTRLISIGGGSDETMIHYLAKMLGF